MREDALGWIRHEGGIWREQKCLKADFGVTAINSFSNSSKKSWVRPIMVMCAFVSEFFWTLTFISSLVQHKDSTGEIQNLKTNGPWENKFLGNKYWERLRVFPGCEVELWVESGWISGVKEALLGFGAPLWQISLTTLPWLPLSKVCTPWGRRVAPSNTFLSFLRHLSIFLLKQQQISSTDSLAKTGIFKTTKY